MNPLADTDAESNYRSGSAVGQWVAVVALAAAGFTAGLTLVWDNDVFWHLAAGQWMLDHGKVLGIDLWSIAPQPAWVNVHWLFQVIIASLFRLGGFAALSALTGILAAGTLVVFALALRKQVPPAWIMLCGLWFLITIAGRVRVRPEAFTLLMLTITIVVTDSVRRGAPGKRLWWLAPMMLAWVNMHGIYILGQALLWSAIGCAAIERWVLRNRNLQGNLLTKGALLPVMATAIVCFLTPWPIDAALRPILLWTRVSGEVASYTYGVSEFYPTWKSPAQFPGPVALVMATALALLINFSFGRVAGKARVPLAHVAWLLAFAFLAALATRNIALVGPVCAFLLAWHGKDIILSICAGKRMNAHFWPALTVVCALVTLLQDVACATELTYRQERAPFHFGAGISREEFPIDMAQWLAALPTKGDIVTQDFGDASAFDYYSSVGRERPVRLVFMDGRLETYDFMRFVQQQGISQACNDTASAARMALPPSVRFVIIGGNSSLALEAMAHCPRFRLVHVERTAACFEDVQWIDRNGPDPLPADSLNLAEFDQPLLADGLVDGTAPRRATWWRQNPASLHYRTGEIMLWLGACDSATPSTLGPSLDYRCALLAARYLDASCREGSSPQELTRALTARAYQQRASLDYYASSAQMPANMDLARSLRLRSQIDMMHVDGSRPLCFAEQYRRAPAARTDAAAEALAKLIDCLPTEDCTTLTGEYVEPTEQVRQRLEQSQKRAMGLEYLPALERAQARSDPQVGLTNRAIKALPAPTTNANTDEPFKAKMLLGDLLLRKGLTEQARSAYQSIPGGTRDIERSLRLALCDWADGELVQASQELGLVGERAVAADKRRSAQPHDEGVNLLPLIRFYQGDLFELMGDYGAARKALEGTQADDPELASLIDRLRLRLENR